MDQARRPALTAFALLIAAIRADAGDPAGVFQEIDSLATNWPAASFSIDVTGVTDRQVILNQPLNIEYEAEMPGYLTYMRISSHGDMTIYAPPGSSAQQTGTLEYTVQAPLGNEQVVVLFSSAKLDVLVPAGDATRSIGADRSSAEDFVHRLSQLEASGTRIAVRHIRYEVAPIPGTTEYTTRGIVFRVLGSTQPTPSSSDRWHCPQTATATHNLSGEVLPSHVEFEFNSDLLTSQGKQDLDEFGSVFIGDLKNSKVVLQGNTDGIGNDEYNMNLSERRASRVEEYLEQSFAIEPGRLRAVGLGKNNPMMPNDTDANRACNRRVDFVVSK